MNHEITKNKYRLGMRVLVVDDSHTCRLVIQKQLKRSEYKVVSVSRASDALKLLHETKGGFDLVVTDVHMPQMNGFELLEIIRRKFRVPVILMSGDDTHGTMIKGLQNGACFYLKKPLNVRQIQDLWLFALRQKVEGSQVRINEVKLRPDVKRKRPKETREEDEDAECPIATKKRLVWTAELHNQFLNAFNKLGRQKAVPKKICELMNINGVSRVNVASHLQKFRASIEKHGISMPSVEPRTPWIKEPRTPWVSCLPRSVYNQKNLGYNQTNQLGGPPHVNNFTGGAMSIIPTMVNQNPLVMPVFPPIGSSYEQAPINMGLQGPHYCPPAGNIGVQNTEPPFGMATQPFSLEGIHIEELPAQSLCLPPAGDVGVQSLTSVGTMNHCPAPNLDHANDDLSKREEIRRGKRRMDEASQEMPPLPPPQLPLPLPQSSEKQQAEKNDDLDDFFDFLSKSNMDELNSLLEDLDKFNNEVQHEGSGISVDPEFDPSDFLIDPNNTKTM